MPLVRSPYFTAMLFELTAAQTLDLAWLDSFVVAVCTAGAGFLRDDRGERMPLRRGETALVPASARCLTFEPAADASEPFRLLTGWVEEEAR